MEQTSILKMIDLLKRKNKYLSDFQDLNQEELVQIQKNNLDNLEAFYFDREILLNAIDRLDQSLKDYKIDQLEDICETTKKQVLELLVQKRELINLILTQDLNIHSFLQDQLVCENKEQIA